MFAKVGVFLVASMVSAVQPAAPRQLRVSSLAATNASSLGDKEAHELLDWYAAHSKGRGVWKWNNALQAYQRHFRSYRGKELKLAEVGVQSGGSIEMWQNFLGDKCHVYGLDINPNTKGFAVDGKVTITMLDQGNAELWKKYFKDVTPSLDILVDDGGHEPHQMMTTLEQVFPHLSPGGLISIEDIHGVEKYLDSFFVPAAHFLGEQAKEKKVASVHMYPFVMIAQRAGKPEGLEKASELTFSGKAIAVSEFSQVWEKIPTNWGNHIVLKNPSWGPFLTPEGIANFFIHFQNLHVGNWYDMPNGCQFTKAAECTTRVSNTQAQAWITGIHIYDDKLVVEIPKDPVVIEAVRRGDTWIGYGL
jgi:hypothetical protein